MDEVLAVGDLNFQKKCLGKMNPDKMLQELGALVRLPELAGVSWNAQMQVPCQRRSATFEQLKRSAGE